jgi:DNA repair ATPase RecN
MAEGYEEQMPYYENMLKISHNQTSTLEKEEVDTEKLIDFIRQRQELINTLEGMSNSLAPLKEQIKEALSIEEFNLSSIKGHLSGPGVDALSEVLERLTGILVQIKENDKQNEERLRAAMEATQNKMKNLKDIKKANKAYQSKPPAGGGVFIDYKK